MNKKAFIEKELAELWPNGVDHVKRSTLEFALKRIQGRALDIEQWEKKPTVATKDFLIGEAVENWQWSYELRWDCLDIVIRRTLPDKYPADLAAVRTAIELAAKKRYSPETAVQYASEMDAVAETDASGGNDVQGGGFSKVD